MSGMASVGLAVFVKTPGLSPIKTRLAASIGTAAALDFFHAALAAVVASVDAARDAPIQPYFAVAETAGLAHWARHPAAWPVLAQGEGELGTRMAQIHDQLLARHAGGILLGADAPWVTPASLRAAATWLAAAAPRACLGPAEDGGFYLYGANRPLSLAAWTQPRYGGPEAARDLLAQCPPQWSWQQLPTTPDLDRASDLERLLASLPAGAHAQQVALHAMLRACIPTS